MERLAAPELVADHSLEVQQETILELQIAGRDLAGSLAEDQPELLADIMWGAAAGLVVDGAAGAYALDRWSDGASALREARR